MRHILLLLLPLLLFSNIGKLISLSGEVSVTRSDKSFKASLGQEILKSDTIKTGKSSRAQLLFSDETIITIGMSSEFSIKEYLFDEKEEEAKLEVNLFKGAFRSITGKIGKIAPKKFILKTRTSTIGIRGTQILAQIHADFDEIACTDGIITVSSLNNLGSVIVPKGQITRLSPTTPPSPPKPYTPPEVKALSQAAGGGKEVESAAEIIEKSERIIEPTIKLEPKDSSEQETTEIESFKDEIPNEIPTTKKVQTVAEDLVQTTIEEVEQTIAEVSEDRRQSEQENTEVSKPITKEEAFQIETVLNTTTPESTSLSVQPKNSAPVTLPVAEMHLLVGDTG
jgi:hypothetical protein